MKSFVKKLMSTVGLLAIASVVCLAEVPAPRVQKVTMSSVSAPKLKNENHSNKVGSYQKFALAKGSGSYAVNFKPLQSNGNAADKAYDMSRHIHDQFMPVRLAGVYHRYSMMSMWDIKESENIKMPTLSDANTLHVYEDGTSPFIRRNGVTVKVTPSDLKLAEDAPLLREGVSQ